MEEVFNTSDVRLRRVGVSDEDFLWLMLFYASHSNDEPGVGPGDVKANVDLRRYVVGWGRTGDVGVIAETEERICGAAWLRLFTESDRLDPAYVDDRTPELAVAVLPGLERDGIGTRMLTSLFESAKQFHPAVVLSVRLGNPAIRLYERLGFRAVSHMTNRVGTESVKMVLTLQEPQGVCHGTETPHT